mmetsp:Transcript_51094/g.134601  ORF Transcript_51094/g.134601 Transcript_51094/m.134601 type:complete len:205 (-) Transcript_51094:1683-2297(-)
MKATVDCVDNVVTRYWDSHNAKFITNLFDGGFPRRVIVEFFEETAVILLSSLLGPRSQGNRHQRLKFLQIDLRAAPVANHKPYQPHRLSSFVWMHTHGVQHALQLVHINETGVVFIKQLEIFFDCLLPTWRELFPEIQNQLVKLCIVQALPLPVFDAILLAVGVLGNSCVEQSDPKHCESVFHLVMLSLVDYLMDSVNIFHVLH